MIATCFDVNHFGKIVLVAGLMLSSMYGCEQKASSKPFGIGIDNNSALYLDYAYVQLPNFRTIDDSIMPGSGFVDAWLTVARPDVFIVRWATGESPTEEHEVQVDLTGKVPQDFDGAIYFIINPDFSVSVKLSENDLSKPRGKPFGRFVEKPATVPFEK